MLFLLPTPFLLPKRTDCNQNNIFPFQEEADAMFNSAQIFELAVLKTFAEPLLFQIPKEEPEYYEAN